MIWGEKAMFEAILKKAAWSTLPVLLSGVHKFTKYKTIFLKLRAILAARTTRESKKLGVLVQYYWFWQYPPTLAHDNRSWSLSVVIMNKQSHFTDHARYSPVYLSSMKRLWTFPQRKIYLCFLVLSIESTQYFLSMLPRIINRKYSIFSQIDNIIYESLSFVILHFERAWEPQFVSGLFYLFTRILNIMKTLNNFEKISYA